jgi:hypothetical protein
MNNFKLWLEERSFDKYKKIILNYLNLDPDNGLSQPLDSLNRDDLYKKFTSLGIFTELPEQKRDEILAILKMPVNKTMGDLIRIMAS